jgi:hypothetical protein
MFTTVMFQKPLRRKLEWQLVLALGQRKGNQVIVKGDRVVGCVIHEDDFRAFQKRRDAQ